MVLKNFLGAIVVLYVLCYAESVVFVNAAYNILLLNH